MTTLDTNPDVHSDILHMLVASPRFAQDGVCFAARDSALYRSDDSGQTWHSCYESLGLETSLTTTSFALSPDFATDQTMIAGVNGGVLRSTNGGATWQVISLAAPAPLVTVVAMSPTFSADGIALIGTLEDGVLRSEDSGQTWAAWNIGLLDHHVLALAISPRFAADKTILLGTESGLFRSTNAGRSWREVILPLEFTTVLSVAVAQGEEAQTWFIGTENDGVFVSTDAGTTWKLSEQKLDGAVNAVLHVEQAAGSQVFALVDDALLVSRDNGTTWGEHTGTESQQIATIALAQTDVSATVLLIGNADSTVRVQAL